MSNAKPTSFWTLIKSLTRVSVNDDIDEEIWRHLPDINNRIQDSAKRAFGVGYEWILEPNKVDIEWPPAAVQTRYNGKHFWYGTDHLFQGVPWDELESIMAQALEGVSVEEDNYLERVTRVQESLVKHNERGIPSRQEMEGTYDIIYYAGEYKYFLRHHRTSRGTLTLTSIRQENGNDCLQGTVAMDPQVSNDMDIIPHGGNFTFVETDRYQRVVTPKERNNDRRRSSSVNDNTTVAGVIQIQVTQAPEGTLDMRYGRVTRNVFRGEFKQLQQRVALGLLRDCPLPWGEDDESPRRVTVERNVEECLEENQKKKETCLLWMRRHLEPSLPPEVVRRVQEFLSPPPFLVLEENDWVLGMVWSGGLPSYSANSCLVVRKRR
ncbi:expressed unknown protein [Seminavis robusta]|uniref:Uncharacterized protein n=1 Tax=Seminavis robusta TaxID=568900 RepID=A0A9N8EPW3_9STRA|nr:expressed unknown protein [Seminavis robusta]|eukprot:Sro1312_g261870.1 n/a (379) ;mRNA; f:29452-30588